MPTRGSDGRYTKIGPEAEADAAAVVAAQAKIQAAVSATAGAYRGLDSAAAGSAGMAGAASASARAALAMAQFEQQARKAAAAQTELNAASAAHAKDPSAANADKLAVAHTAASAEIAKTTLAHIKATDAANGSGASTDALSGKLGGLAASSTQAGGAVGSLQSLMRALGPEGQAAAAVIGVLTIGITALVAAIVTGMGLAIEKVEGLAKLRATLDALGGGAAGGAAALAVVQKLGKDLPFSTAQVSEWAKSLLAAGVAGKDLEGAVKAIAAATALMGDSGGAAAEKMIKQLAEGGEAAKKMMKAVQEGGPKAARLLAEMGLSTADLAKAMGMTPEQFAKATISAEAMNKAIQAALQQKGKGPLDAMMNSWPVIIDKAKSGFLSLFAKLGPAVEPFMKAVRGLFEQFNKGTPTIKALQKIVTETFTAIFKYATIAVVAITKFVKENVNAKSIASTWQTMKPAIFAVGSALGTVIGWLAKLLTYKPVLYGIGILVVGLAGMFILLAAAVALATIAMVIMALPFIVAMAAIVGLVAGIVWLVSNIDQVPGIIADFVVGAITALAGLANAAYEAAGNFIQGLLGGIQAGAGAIIAAVSGLAGAALGAFKSALGIASPSTVMMQQGDHVATGAAEGIEAGSDKVQAASDKMLDPKAPKGARGAAKGGGGSGQPIHFHYAGPIDSYPQFCDHAGRWWEEKAREVLQ